MTDFVLKSETKGMEAQSIVHQHSERTRRYYEILKYAKLLKTPLNIGMFIPCDEEGNIIEDRPEPKALSKGVFNYTAQNIWDEKYNKAKDKVLFKGFEVNELGAVYIITDKNIRFVVTNVFNKGLMPPWNVEYLTKYNLKLTNTALRQLGLELKKALA